MLSCEYSSNVFRSLFFVLISNISFSQSFEWVEAHASEGLMSRFSAIITDANGNVYVAGNFMGKVTVGAQVLEALGSNNQDSYVIKYDAHGNVLWARHITGASNQSIYALTISPDDHILATGSFQGPLSIDGITLTKMSGDFADTFILKFQTDGTVVMGKNIGYSEVNRADIGFGVTTDKFGNIYVAGGRGVSMYFCKLTNTGDIIWRRTAGSTTTMGDLNAGPIVVDDEGFVYVAGVSVYTGQGNLFKLNSSGSFLWTQTFSGSITSLLVDGDNNLLLGGDIYGPTTIGSQNIPLTSGLIGKMDSDGTLLWKSFTAGFSLRDLAINRTDGSVIFSGAITKTVSFDGIEISLEEDSDVLIGMLSKNGFYKWVSKAGEENRAYGDIVAVDDDGNIFMGGEIRKDSIGRFQCIDKTGQSKTDMYVAKIAPFLEVQIVGPVELCEGEEATYSFISVSDYISYEWFTSNSDLEVTTIDPTTIKIKARGKTFSDIGVRTTIDLGCEVFKVNHTLPIVINSFLKKGIISGPAEVCAGRSNVEYSIDPRPSDVSYIWNTQDDVTIQSSTNTKLFINFPDDFTSTEIGLTMTGPCNSVNFDPFLIAVIPVPGPMNAVTTDEVLCADQDVTFHIEPVPHTTRYEWFINVLGGPLYNRTGTTSFDVDVGSSGVVIYVQAYNACGMTESPRSSFNVIRRPSETSPIVGPTELCVGREAEYATSVLSDADAFHWVFTTDKNVKILDMSQISNQMKFSFTQPGTLTVRATNACGEGPVRSLEITKIVDDDIQPVIQRNCNSLSYNGTSVPLSWFKDGEPLGMEPSIQLSKGGNYELRYIGECLERSAFIKINDEDLDVFIPNIITPNGDDKNETFQISKLLQGSKLIMVNRWGEPVYVSDNYANEWDGGNVSTGIYFYTINSVCGNYKGTLSIVK